MDYGKEAVVANYYVILKKGDAQCLRLITEGVTESKWVKKDYVIYVNDP